MNTSSTEMAFLLSEAMIRGFLYITNNRKLIGIEIRSNRSTKCDGVEGLDAWSGGNIMYSQYIFSRFALCRLV